MASNVSGQGTGGSRATEINRGNNVSNATISTPSASGSSGKSGGLNAVNANTAAAYNAAAQNQNAARQAATNTANAPGGISEGARLEAGMIPYDPNAKERLASIRASIAAAGKDDGDDGGYRPGGGYSSGGGGSSPTPGQQYDVNTKLNIPAGKTPGQIAAERAALSAELNPQADPASIDRVNKYDKQPLIDLMNQEIDAARQQYNNQIDYSMDTAARDLNRALTDAQDAFHTQQDQITAEEMQARDNAALYAEARGDKGGIGQAQYNSIQNTAAQNRLQVRNAQTKMATDVSRQISDLRSKGEFDKADRMLQLTQEYLSQLRQIEQYANDFNLSVDQINTAIAEWEYNYNQAAKQFATNTELSLAQLTGAFSNGTPTYAAQQETNQQLASIAMSLIQAGVKPTQLSPEQLGALASVYGMNQTGINQLYKLTN